MTTEAERRVIEAACIWHLAFFGHPPSGHDAELFNAVAAYQHDGEPLAAPTAPDVEGLEKAVADAALDAMESYVDAADGPWETSLAKFKAAREALAAARKPKPVLLTAEEALCIYDQSENKAPGIAAVLSAATERFVAAVEAGPKYATMLIRFTPKSTKA